jgi:hypothetical protein
MYARIIDGEIKYPIVLLEEFPNTSFSDIGPNAEYMTENNLMPVSTHLDHDTETQFLEPCEPYILGDQVYIVKIAEITEQ